MMGENYVNGTNMSYSSEVEFITDSEYFNIFDSGVNSIENSHSSSSQQGSSSQVGGNNEFNQNNNMLKQTTAFDSSSDLESKKDSFVHYEISTANMDCDSFNKKMHYISYLCLAFIISFSILGVLILSLSIWCRGTVYLWRYPTFVIYYVSNWICMGLSILMILSILPLVICFIYGYNKRKYLLVFNGFVGFVILVLGLCFGMNVHFALSLKGDDYYDRTHNFFTQAKVAFYQGKYNADSFTKWEKIQEKFDCCGVKKYKDWKNPSLRSGTGLNISKFPSSCFCDGDDDDCVNVVDTTNSNNTLYIREKSCFEPLQNFFMQRMLAYNIVLPLALILNLALFIVSLVLCVQTSELFLFDFHKGDV